MRIKVISDKVGVKSMEIFRNVNIFYIKIKNTHGSGTLFVRFGKGDWFSIEAGKFEEFKGFGKNFEIESMEFKGSEEGINYEVIYYT